MSATDSLILLEKRMCSNDPLDSLRASLEYELNVLVRRDQQQREKARAQLAALDALLSRAESAERERDRLKAEVKSLKGQLSLANHHAHGRHGDYTRALEERDELRKALEPFSDLLDGLDNEHDNAPIEIEVSIMERGVFTVGDLRRAHAALARTAPAMAPKPRTCGECAKFHLLDELGWCRIGGRNANSDTVHKCFQPRPVATARTCGECAFDGNLCELPSNLTPDTCGYFQPRPGAEEVKP